MKTNEPTETTAMGVRWAFNMPINYPTGMLQGYFSYRNLGTYKDLVGVPYINYTSDNNIALVMLVYNHSTGDYTAGYATLLTFGY